MTYIFVDIETTGLNREVHVGKPDYTLELGFAEYDDDFNCVRAQSWLVGNHNWVNNRFVEAIRESHIIADMHDKSGLITDWFEGYHEGEKNNLLTYPEAQREALAWLKDCDVPNLGAEPMCGSSLRFDREMLHKDMPGIDNAFSYRIIDVSAVRELGRKTDPEWLNAVEKQADESRQNSHRVLDDIQDSVNLLKLMIVNAEAELL